ncbi:MAG: hypothetical protein RR620_08915 [Clostridium sp.]
MKSSIGLKMDREVYEKVKKISFELNMSSSAILRQVLNRYKMENSDSRIKCPTDPSNEIIVRIKATETFTNEEYDDVAMSIANADIIRILNEIYNAEIQK